MTPRESGNGADAYDEDDEDAEELDGSFPLGDGTADMEGVLYCPYCGELNEVALDPGSGALQEYVEDCQVCCRPWVVHVEYHADGSATVRADAADEM
ncbi:MAG: CPXCG motif-containing cysteine-rich protein [Gemmatimonadaceae bacterium]